MLPCHALIPGAGATGATGAEGSHCCRSGAFGGDTVARVSGGLCDRVEAWDTKKRMGQVAHIATIMYQVVPGTCRGGSFEKETWLNYRNSW